MSSFHKSPKEVLATKISSTSKYFCPKAELQKLNTVLAGNYLGTCFIFHKQLQEVSKMTKFFEEKSIALEAQMEKSESMLEEARSELSSVDKQLEEALEKMYRMNKEQMEQEEMLLAFSRDRQEWGWGLEEKIYELKEENMNQKDEITELKAVIQQQKEEKNEQEAMAIEFRTLLTKEKEENLALMVKIKKLEEENKTLKGDIDFMERAEEWRGELADKQYFEKEALKKELEEMRALLNLEVEKGTEYYQQLVDLKEVLGYRECELEEERRTGALLTEHLKHERMVSALVGE